MHSLAVDGVTNDEVWVAWNGRYRLMARVHEAEVRQARRPERLSVPMSFGIAAVNAGTRLKKSNCGRGPVKSKFFKVVPEILCIQELDGIQRKGRKVSVPDYAVWRKWPGSGSRSLAFVVHKRLLMFVTWKGYLDRAGAILLSDDASARILVVQAHGPRNLTEMRLSDVVSLMRSSPTDAPVIVVGDWNVDQLHILKTFGAPPLAEICGTEMSELFVCHGK